MSDTNTQGTSTLKGKMAGFRSKAREVLRMEMINRRMDDIFDYKRALKSASSDLELSKRIQAGRLYDIEKLDTEHPQHEDKKELLESYVEGDVKHIETHEDEVKRYTEKLEKLEKEIEDIEAGEKKVDFARMSALASELASKA